MRRAAARSPHPTFCPHLSGTRGGLAAPRRGATVSRCQPLSTRPKNPGNGCRRRPPRKRLLRENSTPSAHPLGGYGPLGSADADGGRRRGCLHPCHSACARRSSPGGAGRVGGLPSTPVYLTQRGASCGPGVSGDPGAPSPPTSTRALGSRSGRLVSCTSRPRRVCRAH